MAFIEISKKLNNFAYPILGDNKDYKPENVEVTLKGLTSGIEVVLPTAKVSDVCSNFTHKTLTITLIYSEKNEKTN